PYKPDLTPLPSSLRPHVLAKERIIKWLPASGETTTDRVGDRERVRQVLKAGWDESTLNTYGSGLLVFHVFCDAKQIPESDRTPSPPDLLSSFTAALAGTYSATAISNYLAGLRAWHILNRLEWCPNEAEINVLLRAAVKTAPSTAKRPKRIPFTIDSISKIHAHLNLDNPLHRATFACLTTAFYATARLGEFTVPNLSSFDPTLHPSRSCLETVTDRNGIQTTILHLPRTKTSKSGEDVYWTSHEGISNPTAALDAHLRINNPPTTAHIFAYPQGKEFRPLTRRNFLSVVNAAAKEAGFGPLQGHGIRIGSTLQYLLAGLSFEAMRTKGRWASDAFYIYVTRHAEVI
ncbi:hypothetical protein AGABI2DRAFT_58700, partial [Agaricus bisporus var. bisporus H97]|uniref:hypothetical protein n=1 Tax=Agaricus bisporus var. bisporus (strain H97 / ATCC MYA-4626 / FGSC 10389) TaxID=936046 RepID=UPI00029F67DB